MPKYKITLADGTTQVIQADKPPEVDKVYAPSYMSKVGKDVLQTASAFTPLLSALPGYKLGKEALAPAVSKALNVGPESSIMAKPEIAKKLGYETTEDRYGPLKEIGMAAAEPYLHPIKSLKEGKIASTAAAWAPVALGVRGLLKGKLKTAPPKTAPAPKPTIDTAEVLPINLEKTNIQNIAGNEFVRKNTTNFLGKQSAEIAKEAADLTKQVKPAIRKAQNDFYQKLGIKNKDILDDGGFAVNRIKAAIESKAGYLDDIHLKKAQNIYEEMATSPKLTFGKVKEIARNAYDLAEENVNEVGKKTMAGRFFDDIGDALTELKRTDPRIAEAGGKYNDLLNAEKLINKTLRLNRELGEKRLEGLILSSFKDKGMLNFKENLNTLESILKKYPETESIVKSGGFTDKIKLAQLSNDIATKRAVTPTGLGRTPGIKHLINIAKVGDPEFQAMVLRKGIESGKINPEAVMGKSELKTGMFMGKAATRYGALRDVLKSRSK